MGTKQILTGVALLSSMLVLPAIAAGMPSVSIQSPKPGQTVKSADIPVSLTVHDFQLEVSHIGQPGKMGRGHIHVMLDGMDMAHLTNVTPATHFSISGQGVKPGKHMITVLLASDDHMPASKPAMVSFNYEPAKIQPLPKPIAGGTPSVAILWPKNGATVSKKFTLRVDTRNFHVSCAEGKPDVAGYGHLHVIVNQKGVTDQPAQHMTMPMMTGGMKPMPMTGMVDMPCSTTIPLDLSTWKSGKATISVMLAKNDHSPVAAQPAMITVNLK